MVSTPLKNISQIGSSSQLLGKIKFMFQTTNQISVVMGKSSNQMGEFSTASYFWLGETQETQYLDLLSGDPEFTAGVQVNIYTTYSDFLSLTV